MKHDDRVVVKARAVIPGFGVGPWVFAAGSVDAPASIGTAQLASQAATVVQFTSAASGTRSASSPDYFINHTSTINTDSWTNNTSAAVSVQIDHSVRGYLSSSGAGTGSIWFIYEYSLSGGGGAGAVASGLGRTSDETDFTYVDQKSVPAGSTITVTLKAVAYITSGTQVTNNWRDANTRISAILR